MIHTFIAFVISLALLSACTSKTGDTGQGEGSPTERRERASSLYVDSIMPILQRSCVPCHSEGNIAPFSLRDPADNFRRRHAIADAVSNRRMPPWAMDISSSYLELRDPKVLSAEQISSVQAWASAVGSLKEARELPEIPKPVKTGDPHFDVELSMARPFVAEKSMNFDEFRCFLLEASLPLKDEEFFVSSFKVIPGNSKIVHHAILYAVRGENIDQLIESKMNEDERDGYSCFGGLEIEAPQSIVAVWGPGAGQIDYPDGTGVLVPKGSRFVMQVHYSLVAADSIPPKADLTRVHMNFSSEAKLRGEWISPGITDFKLKPGQNRVELSSTRTVEDWFQDSQKKFKGKTFTADIYAFLPHMHLLGRTMTLNSVAPKTFGLFHVPAYDFNWQNAYYLRSPLRVSSSDKWNLKCTYDTTSVEVPIQYGERTTDEMCFGIMFIVPEGVE